ncbi:MAG: PAC2 family protein [Candidatus Nanoarchaeia archaeon]
MAIEIKLPNEELNLEKAQKQIHEPNYHDIIPHLKTLAYGAKKIETKLKIKPKKDSIIIVGFPGFGFVATIAIEYLVDHLKTHSLGYMWSPRLAAAAFVHQGKVLRPLEIFHNDKYNIILIEAISGISGLEWEITEAILELYKKINAKEIICIEGVNAPMVAKEPQVYFYANNPHTAKSIESLNIKQIKDGVIFGVAGALMMKAEKNVNASFFFAETHSDLPDSRAAAKVIEILDKYLKLDIDYKPLLKRAAEFEARIQKVIEKAKTAVAAKKEKEAELPYIG